MLLSRPFIVVVAAGSSVANRSTSTGPPASAGGHARWMRRSGHGRRLHGGVGV